MIMDNLYDDLVTGLTEEIEYKKGILPAKDSAESDNMLRLWTIQSEDVYEELMREGVYHTKPELAFCRDIPEIEFCYRWMSQKLSEKAGPPPEGLTYPIWAWHTWEGKRKIRDMRCSGYGERGRKMVQMEIEIPESRILLSDFDLWGLILYGYRLDMETEDDMDEFYLWLQRRGFRDGMNLVKLCDGTSSSYDISVPEEIWMMRDEIIKSWDICLGKDQKQNDLFMGSRGRSIQAVFWELKREDVKKEWHFTCR
jgi:hypothetical protein